MCVYLLYVCVYLFVFVSIWLILGKYSANDRFNLYLQFVPELEVMYFQVFSKISEGWNQEPR